MEEKTPPALYNHGFENMDSVGALYSRASSHIFGDWNACGKVMGLAPWIGHAWTVPSEESEQITATNLTQPIMKGKLYHENVEDSFQVDRSAMMRTPFFARNDPDLFDNEGKMVRSKRYDFDGNDSGEGEESSEVEKNLPTNAALDAISLAYRIQNDLEDVALDFVKYCKDKTKQDNLCLAGGVALNSVLNGRLSRELGFKNVFIPPYPGDDGIAVGCCAYGLFGDQTGKTTETSESKVWSQPLSPYLGPEYSQSALQAAIEEASPWLEVEKINDDKEKFEVMSKEIESGGVIAWYQGRSEMGPRALGHRSILADPRKKGLVRFINESVKSRESFRPFAPSALAEEVDAWFLLGDDLEDTSNISPYMSMTAKVRRLKRPLIPAVTHVDGSSRLQTVTKESEPQYHKFISTFFQRTGVPMVLNTSFNTIPSEPIVETPGDAIRSFLCSMGSIEMLVMENYVIKRRDADVRRLLGENDTKGTRLTPSNPKRAGPAYYESKFKLNEKNSDDNGVETITRVQMPSRPMHIEGDGGWFELLDELEGEILGICDGSVSVNDIVNHYLQISDEGQVANVEDVEYQEILFSNVIRRLVRLYEHSLISW